MLTNGKLDNGGAGKCPFLVFGYCIFQKNLICFFPNENQLEASFISAL